MKINEYGSRMYISVKGYKPNARYIRIGNGIDLCEKTYGDMVKSLDNYSAAVLDISYHYTYPLTIFKDGKLYTILKGDDTWAKQKVMPEYSEIICLLGIR